MINPYELTTRIRHSRITRINTQPTENMAEETDIQKPDSEAVDPASAGSQTWEQPPFDVTTGAIYLHIPTGRRFQLVAACTIENKLHLKPVPELGNWDGNSQEFVRQFDRVSL